MKTKFQLIIIIALVPVLILLAAPVVAQSANNGSIAGKVSTINNASLANVKVMLVNSSNTSEEIKNVTSSIDGNGNFQFINLPYGSYKVFAYAPQFASGLSETKEVVSNVTYTANVVILPEPYYADMYASETSIPLESGKTRITVTVYDFWENKIGAGWFITFYSTAGSLNPTYGETDANSQFVTVLSAPYEGTFATINVSAKARNGTYYPLQQRIVSPAPTATPIATATPIDNVTVTPTPVPTAAPNATATPTPTVPTATPTPAPTPTPTPGFELMAALGGLALVAAYKKMR